MDTSPAPGATALTVGVDGSRPSLRALAWACRDAERLHRPLHVLHAYLTPMVYVGPGTFAALEATDVTSEHVFAQRTLDDAVATARSLTSRPVTGELVRAPAAAALVVASPTCDVVVGSRGRGAFSSAVLGSVSAQVAAHAHGAVVVVKDVEEPADGRRRVVVGVDGSPASQDCLAFAFEQAAALGTGLLVVHAWPFELTSGAPEGPGTVAAGRELAAAHERVVDEALDGWATRHPGVEVRRSVVHDFAVSALVDSARDAELLVVGSRGRGGFAGLLLGSVSHGVLHRATCPVAVVRGTR